MDLSSDLVIFSILFLISILSWRLGKPRLDPKSPNSNVPINLSLLDLDIWLKDIESKVIDLMPSVEAHIGWADPSDPRRTRICFLYIHGFSATPKETSPLTEQLAQNFSCNYILGRLAGHGVKNDINASAEDWLQSVVDCWHIAQQLGDKVVIIGTSTGATLSVWLARQVFTKDKIFAAIFLAPNFRPRHYLDSPFFSISSILTLPWSRYWISLFIGKRRELSLQNELERKFSSHGYSVSALIEMQKIVDWARTIDYTEFSIPLCTMYMKNDPTIDSKAAVKVHEKWGSDKKELIPVTLNEESIEHVFVGDMMAPSRTDWCKERLELFLNYLDRS